MREFVATRLRPHADHWEAAGWFPNEAFRWLAEAGYLGLGFPREYGGRDDAVAAAVLVEEMARCGSGGVAAGLGAHAGIALPPISTFGTEQQKQRYLLPGLRGEEIAALAITEPGAGSEVRDARLGPIGGGTDEIMREIVGRSLGSESWRTSYARDTWTRRAASC
jgi:acyl-CoA dehydrogenase